MLIPDYHWSQSCKSSYENLENHPLCFSILEKHMENIDQKRLFFFKFALLNKQSSKNNVYMIQDVWFCHLNSIVTSERSNLTASKSQGKPLTSA